MLDALNNREAAMATPNRPAPQALAALAQFLPLERTFRDAMKLAQRFQKAEGFRAYVRRRAAFVVPAVALFVLISVACAAAIVILLAERHAMLALPGMVLAPFVLLASFFVEAFVFFSWLEGRALAQALGRRGGNEHFDFGPLPRVPTDLMNRPFLSYFTTRESPYPSDTKMLPWGSQPMSVSR